MHFIRIIFIFIFSLSICFGANINFKNKLNDLFLKIDKQEYNEEIVKIHLEYFLKNIDIQAIELTFKNNSRKVTAYKSIDEKSVIFINKRFENKKKYSIFRKDIKKEESPFSSLVLYYDLQNENLLSINEKNWLKKNPIIRVSMTKSMNSYVQFDKNKKIIGFNVELLKMINENIGVQLVPIVYETWAESYNSVLSLDTDAIMNLSWSKKREKEDFLYTQSYHYEPYHLIVKKDNNNILNFSNLNNKVVWARKKSITISILKKNVPSATIKTLSSIDKIYQKLSNNEGIAVLVSDPDELKLEKYGLKIAKEVYDKAGELHIGVNKNRALVASIISKGLSSIDPKALVSLKKHWLEDKKLDLTLEERLWLQSHPIIKVGINNSWAPMNYVNDKGVPTGIGISYLNLINKKLDNILKVYPDTFSNNMQKVKDKVIDTLMDITPSIPREEFFSFTDPYLIIPHTILAKKDNKEYFSDETSLNNKKVAIEQNYITSSYVKKAAPDANIIFYKNTLEAIKAVSRGEVDVYVGNKAVSSFIMKRNFIINLDFQGKANRVGSVSAFGVRKDWQILRNILQKALSDLTAEEKNSIISKFIDMSNNKVVKQYVTQKDIDTKVSFIGLVSIEEILFALFILVISILVIYNNYRKSTVLNIKLSKFIILIILFEFSVTLFLIYEVVTLDRTENLLAKTYKNKAEMIQVTDKLRQGSDDLTHFARTYAVTNNAKYKNQYYDTLDIRNGKKARPLYYNSIYWDLNLKNRDINHPSGNKESLKSIMNKLPFTKSENELLELALNNSNELTNLESLAFKAMEKNKQSYAIKLLHSREYYKGKEKVMEPLDRMLITMIINTDNKIEYLNSKINNQFFFIFIVSLFFILGNFVIYLLLVRKISKPVSYLSNVIEHFKFNKEEIEKKDFYDDEIGDTIKQFFVMKEHIEEQQKDMNNLNINLEKIVESKTEILNKQKQELEFMLQSFDENVMASKTDMNGILTYVSKAFCQISEYSKDELIGSSHSILKHPDMEPTVFKDMWNTIVSKNIWKGEVKNKKKNGGFYWSYSIVSPEYNLGGNIIGYSSIRQDITAKKEVEELSSNLEKKVDERTFQLNDEKKFINSVMNSQSNIVITGNKVKLQTVNKAFLAFFDIKNIEQFEERIGTSISDSFLYEKEQNYIGSFVDEVVWFDYVYKQKNIIHKVLMQKNNQKHIFSINVDKFIFNHKILYTAVFTDITELERIRREVEEIHTHTKESIEYASLIQHSIIPSKNLFKKYFKESFIIWHPKDIVGGDIYLFSEIEDGNGCILMVIDCTGHGIPGAFVTMLVKAIETQIIMNILYKGKKVSTSDILSQFNKGMKHILKQESDESILNSGFDGGIIYFNKKEKIIQYSGSNTSLHYTKDNKLKLLKGDRHSIGYRTSDINYKFTEYEIAVEENMNFYISTDGYIDQNGGIKGFPFGKRKFMNIIKNNYQETLENQRKIFLDTLYEYQKNEDRNDDITLIGFKI